MTPEDLCFTSATDMAALIRGKAVSPIEVIEAFLARIDTVNWQLNAYVSVLSELARRAAHSAEAAVMSGAALGLLYGVPFSVKDLIFTAGVRTTAGARVFRDFIPKEDAIVVARLKAAGGIFWEKRIPPSLALRAQRKTCCSAQRAIPGGKTRCLVDRASVGQSKRQPLALPIPVTYSI